MRTIQIALKEFPSTPAALCAEGGGTCEEISVRLKDLSHHHFLLSGGDAPPGTLADFVYHLTSGPDWRFKNKAGDKEYARNTSNELGKAFARWFCYTYLNFTYFYPVEKALKHEYPNFKWQRREKGDLPDYICGPDEHQLNVLEAKGSFTKLNFGSAQFEKWRKQVNRLELRDHNNHPLRVKGFVSAGFWATAASPKSQSVLMVEDPWTAGEEPRDGLPEDAGFQLIGGHYAGILKLLQMPILADALEFGFGLPDQIGMRVGHWVCGAGPLEGREFIGGLIPPEDDFPGRRYWHYYGPEFLSSPMRFFGIDKQIFDIIVKLVRQPGPFRMRAPKVEIPQNTGSLSLLRDGSILGPAHYFRFIEPLNA